MFWKLGKATIPTFSLGGVQNTYFPEKVVATANHSPQMKMRGDPKADSTIMDLLVTIPARD